MDEHAIAGASPQHRVREAAAAVASRLRSADAPPFIGQLPLSPAEELAASDFLRCENSFNALSALLEHCPALGLALVASRVASQAIASLDERDVYGPIEAMLGLESLRQDQRQQLFQVFRGACIRLGLTVQRQLAANHPQWRVNEFLLQGGARRGHARGLADAFRRTERTLGLPEPTDTMDCVRFCDAASERLSNLPRLRMILENDQTGWHASVFARLRRGQAQPWPIAKSMEAALADSGSVGPAPGRRGPELVLRGVDLCVSVPDGVPLTLDDDGRRSVVSGGDIPIVAPWPKSLRWQVRDGEWAEVAPWMAHPDACALFDAEAGTLLGSVRPGGAATVRPGQLAVASRCPFTVGGERAEAFMGGVFLAWVPIEGAEVAITVPGMAPALVRPRIERRISLGEPYFQDIERTAVFGARLTAEISVPGDVGKLLVADLLLRHRSLGPTVARIPVDLDEAGMTRVDLNQHLPAKGSFERLHLALALRGADRALVSTSVWLWPGLREFDGARFHGPVPDNFDAAVCRGIHRDADGLAVSPADGQWDAALRFGGKALRLMAPGIHAWVERPGTAERAASPVPPASPIPLGGNLGSVLRIACDRPEAVLEVGPASEAAAFARNRVRRITFASLAAALEDHDGEVRVRYRGPSDAPFTVCRLVRAESPSRFMVWLQPNSVRIGIESLRRLDAVALECTDLATGLWRTAEPAISASDADERVACRLTLSFSQFPDGIWLVEPYCRLASVAGLRPMRDSEGARYTMAFPVRHGTIGQRLDPELLTDAAGAFRRAATSLRIPVVGQFAGTAGLAGNVYFTAGRKHAEREPAAAARAFAVDLAGGETMAESPGFIPAKSPFDVSLGAFSFPAQYYGGLPERPEFASFAGLAALSHAPMLKDALAGGRFDPMVAVAFSNFPSAHRVRAIDLTDFDFALLPGAFGMESGLPVDEPPLLGRAFFSGARWDAAFGLAETQANPANGQRVGQALFVARQSLHAPNGLAREAAALAAGTMSCAPGVPYIAPDDPDEGDPGGVEDLLRFLSALALAARLDARGARHLPSFMDGTRQRLAGSQDSPMAPEAAAGICARAAPQFFAAHLLLWEMLIRSRLPNA